MNLQVIVVGLLLALILPSSTAQPLPSWLGLRPSTTPFIFDLVLLNDSATILSVVGSFSLGDEIPFVDTLRCLPGFCVFSAQSPLASTSSIYKVSNVNATILFNSTCPGACAHMHYDIPSSSAVTLSFVQPSSWSIISYSTVGVQKLIGDISTAVGSSGNVGPGQTTHCSATKHIYVGVNNGGAGKDVILAASLTDGTIDGTTHLQKPLFDALWASCDGNTSRVFGGITFTAGHPSSTNGTLEFGAVDSNGAYYRDAVVSVAPGYEPMGMLTATSDRATGNDFIALLYPPNYHASDPSAQGLAWLVDPWGTATSADEVSEFNYNLIAASWSRSNWLN